MLPAHLCLCSFHTVTRPVPATVCSLLISFGVHLLAGELWQAAQTLMQMTATSTVDVEHLEFVSTLMGLMTVEG